MGLRFEELGWSRTPIGEISLRRRREPGSCTDIFEVKLGEEFLMSSQFIVAEVELARLALDRVHGSGLSVAVGGLGLGYTAQAALADERVRDLLVVEALEPVIHWHERGLVPVGPVLTGDGRCRLVHGDFFSMAEGPGFDPLVPDRVFDAVLVDIDHSPRHHLADASAGFYDLTGCRRLVRRITPGGVFALWSNDPPDDDYLGVLRRVFVDVAAEVVSFPNPLQGRAATNTVYLATAPA